MGNCWPKPVDVHPPTVKYSNSIPSGILVCFRKNISHIVVIVAKCLNSQVLSILLVYICQKFSFIILNSMLDQTPSNIYIYMLRWLLNLINFFACLVFTTHFIS